MEEKIGFVGYDSEDIIFYLAHELKQRNRTVLVEDRTEQGILLCMLELTEGGRDGEEKQGVFQDIPVTDSVVHCEEYDVVLQLFGYRLSHPKLYECSKLVLVTDGFPAHARLLEKLAAWDRKQVLILRNAEEAKHSVSYLEMLSGQKAEKICQVPWEGRDIRIRNSLGTAENIRPEKLSQPMRETVRELAEFVLSEEMQGQKEDKRRKQTWEKWLRFGLLWSEKQR